MNFEFLACELLRKVWPFLQFIMRISGLYTVYYENFWPFYNVLRKILALLQFMNDEILAFLLLITNILRR